MTYSPNAEGGAATSSTIVTASTAPHVSLLPASHIAETVGDEIDDIIVLPVLPPHGRHASRRHKDEEEEKEGHACGCSCDCNQQCINCNANAIYHPHHEERQDDRQEEVHRAHQPSDVSNVGVNYQPREASCQGIAHQQKWVTNNAETIIGNIANNPTSGRQWHQKGPSGKRIAPGNPDFADMLPLAAFIHMIPPELLDLMLEVTNERLAAKAKKELTRQELPRWWIGVCMLIASINFRGNCHKLWEGGGATSKYLPSMTCVQQVCRVTASTKSGVPSGGLVNHPSSQTACHRSGIIGC